MESVKSPSDIGVIVDRDHDFGSGAVVAERWPDLAPGFIALLPRHVEQLAPLVGVLLTVAARLISQAAVIEAFRRLFRRK